MEYKEAIDFLFSTLPMFSKVGASAYHPGLETSHELDRMYNFPHKKYKCIHVGGTNGKGSTSHFLASVLQEQGYKVGLYTSPQLVDFRERMKINGEMIPESKVIEFVEKWKATGYSGNPSFFELTMMMAFNWFAEERVDFAVIEVGLGGRLDSTNIIYPVLSIITNISNDHSQILGDTLAKIAIEKAGIIKPGTPVVIGEADGEIKVIFKEKAEKEGCEIIFAEETHILKDIAKDRNGFWDCDSIYGTFTVPLGGDYQKKNINTALVSLKELKKEGILITDENIRKGFFNVVRNTGLNGRWTIISDSPLTIVDTGHNEAGIASNMNQLDKLIHEKKGKLRIIIGFVADKAIDKIVGFLPQYGEFYITNPPIPRALPASELHDILTSHGLKGRCFKDVKEAYREALEDSSGNDIIFIGGSTYLVADFLT